MLYCKVPDKLYFIESPYLEHPNQEQLCVVLLLQDASATDSTWFIVLILSSLPSTNLFSKISPLFPHFFPCYSLYVSSLCFLGINVFFWIQEGSYNVLTYSRMFVKKVKNTCVGGRTYFSTFFCVLFFSVFFQ